MSSAAEAPAGAAAATDRPVGDLARHRLQWLDAARGIGIVLVVYAHGARALADVLPHTEAFWRVDGVIYAFHMPLFFFLAGLVSRGSLSRSRANFLRGKLLTVVYPYFLWSVAYWALELAFSDRVNSPLDPASILWILWKPIEHLWFLYVLFACQVLAAAAWPRVWILVLLSLWIFAGPLPEVTVPMLWVQLPWFVAGLLLAPVVLQPGTDPVRRAAVALAIAATCAAGLVLLPGLAPLARTAEFLAAGIGIGCTVALAIAVQSSRAVTYLGKASLTIYLLHTMISAGVREFLEVVYPVDAIALLVITVAAGLVAPLAIDELARRTRTAPYLGLGKMAPGGPDDQRDGDRRTA
jgi:fucose 4-O-acetylase-like acetyltransferase